MYIMNFRLCILYTMIETWMMPFQPGKNAWKHSVQPTGVACRFNTRGETRICRPPGPLGGRGHASLGKFLKFVSLKWHFPHSGGTFEQNQNIKIDFVVEYSSQNSPKLQKCRPPKSVARGNCPAHPLFLRQWFRLVFPPGAGYKVSK